MLLNFCSMIFLKSAFLLYAAGLCIAIEALGNNRTNYNIRRRRSLDTIFKIFSPKTVCYDSLGCFYTGPPFQNFPLRPIPFVPLPPEIIATTFHMYTRKNWNNPFTFGPNTMQTSLQSHFDPGVWTRIIVHGFFDGTYFMAWILNLKDDFLRLADDNVIIVDHSTTALLPRIVYPQSAVDTRVIGAQVANLITFLVEKYGADTKKFHVVGHSLGAEVAGYAGERLKHLGRITALDPAGPWFRESPRIVQVDDTDAIFVDVIHSNPAPNIVFGLGNPEDLGHINFWPNGGVQKGCPLTVLRTLFNGVALMEPIRTAVNCRHTRSCEFFMYSFSQSDCLFVGVECPTYDDFLDGRCNCGEDGEKCEVMGVFAAPRPPPRRRYYLKTGYERPYCLHQYQISVYLQTNGYISNTKSLKAKLIINGRVKIEEYLKLNIDLRIQEQMNTFLIFSHQKIGNVHSAEISSFGVISNDTVIEAVKINYLFPAPREDTEVILCKPSSKQEALHKHLTFSSKDCT